jgi:CRP-like cAMP-binding protein
LVWFFGIDAARANLSLARDHGRTVEWRGSTIALRYGSESIRIASLARGTIIGEMSLIDSARRSATIVADEAVVCYELLRNDFDAMLSNQPEIATKLLSNLARELSRRLRLTSQDLRGRN